MQAAGNKAPNTTKLPSTVPPSTVKQVYNFIMGKKEGKERNIKNLQELANSSQTLHTTPAANKHQDRLASEGKALAPDTHNTAHL